MITLLALIMLALHWASRPPRVSALITNRVGAALDLQITARGVSEYRLRGTPMLVLRDVTAREPSADHALLQAKRISIALPWSTLRSGGNDLIAKRIELDAPQLDLPALQHWLATRPPSKARLPTLTDGLRIRDGAIINDDWRIDGIHADLSALSPTLPLQARLRGRYLAAPLTIPVDLAVAIVHPEALIKAGTTGIATHGRITIERARDWRMPATVVLSGPLHFGKDDLRITPARLGMAATFEAGDTHTPFALGAYGPLRFDEATWTLAPAGIALRGRGDEETDLVPTLDAHGTLALGRHLTVQLDGNIAQWPPAWPALPPPLGQSKSSLPFALRYDGAPGFADVASLQVQRDATLFAGHFRLPQVLDWINQPEGAPLPPLAGTLTTPELEISGARLEGVEVEFGDDAVTP
ncbi:MAG TPA: hypothetical protein VGQ93_15760 [Lysobacter sp.]|nr:hypothetical protein [Lysobacter sp.]